MKCVNCEKEVSELNINKLCKICTGEEVPVVETFQEQQSNAAPIEYIPPSQTECVICKRQATDLNVNRMCRFCTGEEIPDDSNPEANSEPSQNNPDGESGAGYGGNSTPLIDQLHTPKKKSKIIKKVVYSILGIVLIGFTIFYAITYIADFELPNASATNFGMTKEMFIMKFNDKSKELGFYKQGFYLNSTNSTTVSGVDVFYFDMNSKISFVALNYDAENKINGYTISFNYDINKGTKDAYAILDIPNKICEKINPDFKSFALMKNLWAVKTKMPDWYKNNQKSYLYKNEQYNSVLSITQIPENTNTDIYTFFLVTTNEGVKEKKK